MDQSVQIVLTTTGKAPPSGRAATATLPSRPTVAERRARLVVQCACELLGIDAARAGEELRLPLSVDEFAAELHRRYAATHPALIYRTDSTLERARLTRAQFPELPRVVLRQGAPPRGARPAGTSAAVAR